LVIHYSGGNREGQRSIARFYIRSANLTSFVAPIVSFWTLTDAGKVEEIGGGAGGAVGGRE
jgi:hypothetical protein